MYPWTTPPTSWPAPPQPTTPSSTWPQSSQSAHLFGHPSPLHPTWSSSAPTSLPFTSLPSAPHAVPGPQLVPTMPTPMAPETTLVHTAPPTFPTPTAPTAPPTWHSPPTPSPIRRLHHLHRLRHRHLCRVLHTHLTTFNLHNRRTQRWSLQMNLHHQQLRQLPGFALTRKRTDHVDQLRKPRLLLHHRHQRRHRLHPFHLNLQRWDPLHNNLRNRFDLFKLNNN